MVQVGTQDLEYTPFWHYFDSNLRSDINWVTQKTGPQWDDELIWRPQNFYSA
jgi:hypothetical protein